MEELLRNTTEFIELGEDNLKNKRYNASVSDFFKAIVILCDYLIYQEIKMLPKNHNERFNLLKKYFTDIYLKVFDLFKTYTASYNLRLDKRDAEKIKDYTYELERYIENKKGSQGTNY